MPGRLQSWVDLLLDCSDVAGALATNDAPELSWWGRQSVLGLWALSQSLLFNTILVMVSSLLFSTKRLGDGKAVLIKS